MDVVKDFFFIENLNELVNFIENQSNDLINKLLSTKSPVSPFQAAEWSNMYLPYYWISCNEPTGRII